MERGENVVGVSTFLWWISWGIGVHTSAHKRTQASKRTSKGRPASKAGEARRTGTDRNAS